MTGTYVFRLTVTDNSGATAYDDVAITVTGSIAPGQPPVANAGQDQTLPVGQATVLHGETSTAAPSGTLVKYTWTKVSGPAAFEMLTPDASATWVRNMTAGVYVYRVTVTDNYGTSASDDVTLTVGSTTPPPPTPSANLVAIAGKDQSVPVGQATVLHGEESTGTNIKSYQWTKYSGPAAFEMLTPNASATWLRNMTAGVYVFRLTITDNNGATSYDDITITVGGGTTTTTPPPTAPPTSVLVANAGKDEVIPVGQATVLHGENSTVTGSTIKSYTWTKYSGPASYELLTPTSSASWVRKMTAGTYVYRLTVTDNSGNTSYDDMTITVY
jgi:hypothetical protein